MQTGEYSPCNPGQESDYALLFRQGTRDTCCFVARARSSVVCTDPQGILSRAPRERQPIHATLVERACLAEVLRSGGLGFSRRMRTIISNRISPDQRFWGLGKINFQMFVSSLSFLLFAPPGLFHAARSLAPRMGKTVNGITHGMGRQLAAVFVQHSLLMGGLALIPVWGSEDA